MTNEVLDNLVEICSHRGISLDSPLAAAVYACLQRDALAAAAVRDEAREWVEAARCALARGEGQGVTTGQVCVARGVPVTRSAAMECGTALRNAGWSKSRKMADGVRHWIYSPPV